MIKHILLFLCFLLDNSSICFGQNSSTFYITKNTKPDKVRIVLIEGVKLKVKYAKSGELNSIKGNLTKVSATSVGINGLAIELSEIEKVTVHNRNMKFLGGFLLAGGTGLITAGLIRANNPKEVIKQNNSFIDFGNTSYTTVIRDGSTMMTIGGILCGLSAPFIVVPSAYSKSKFRFTTHVKISTSLDDPKHSQ